MYEKLFLQYIKNQKRYSSNTHSAYEADLVQFHDFLNSEQLTTEIHLATSKQIRLWISKLSREGMEHTTLRRKLSTLKSFYKFLVSQNIIETSPTRKIVFPKVKQRLPIFVDQNQLTQSFESARILVNPLKNATRKVVIELLYGTGIRVSELCNLQMNDINLIQRQIKVTGKRNKQRIVPLTLPAMNAIEQYVLALNQATGTIPSKNFLLNPNQKNFTRRQIYSIVHAYLLENTTVEKCSPHILRHSYATHLLNAGANLNAIKTLLGHTSLAATQVYTHNSFEQLKSIYKQAHPRA